MTRWVVLVLVMAGMASGGCKDRGGDPGGGAGEGRAAPRAAAAREVANLHAFAQLYGAMRWFHPSDEAAAIDWNRYAVVGVRAVRGAADDAALERALEAWVAPIGPTVQILGPGEAVVAHTVDASAPQVAWQHLGPGFDGGQVGTYLSKRTNRTARVRTSTTLGSLAQRLDATPLRGRTVRLRAAIRAGASSRAAAWLRVDRADAVGFLDNMNGREITAPTWTVATIEGPVAADATAVAFGGLAQGDQADFDDFTLEVADGAGGWAPVAITNGDFTDDTTGWTTGTGGKVGGTSFTLSRIAEARDGGAAVRLEAGGFETSFEQIEERPAADEVAELALGSGLRARVPLSLASAGDHTVPAGDLAAAQARVDGLGALAAGDADVRIADVVVAWNLFAHFYPYLDVIATRWPDALDGPLAAAIAARTAEDGRAALMQVVTLAEDGHGMVAPDPRLSLPVRFERVEGAIAAVTSAVPEVQRGDVVRTVDGVPAAAVLEAARAFTSGSPQWRDATALAHFGSGPAGPVRLGLERDGKPIEVSVARGMVPAPAESYPPIGELAPGVWLVDLSRAEMPDLDAKMATLAAARGVIFDVRRYPNGTHEVLQHLLAAPETARWMHVAHVIRPGGVAVGWTSHGWDRSPKAPRLAGKVVFVTGAGAISYAESVMGYVEALGLPIVGEATAGTNGNVRVVMLPSGAEVRFTGMKVTRHDGARSHLEGIRPTVPAARTLAGLRAGRDEVVERALALIEAP